jgi:hypothetical protein
MNIALKLKARDELQRQFADLFARRAELAADKAQADAVRRLDGDIEALGRSLADAERALRMAT